VSLQNLKFGIPKYSLALPYNIVHIAQIIVGFIWKLSKLYVGCTGDVAKHLEEN
jgi:hypothetical protein